MKINEIIVEKQQVNEIVGRAIAGGLGALAGGILGGPAGAAAGAAGGTWLAQKVKNVFDPEDPLKTDPDKVLNVTVNEILGNYKTTLKRAGTLTPDQVVNWANNIFAQTYIPGTQVPYTFKTPPTATDFKSVERWVRQSMKDAEQENLRNPAKPDGPLGEVPPIPPDGSSLRTNRGMYSVVGGAWVDTAGNPASDDISNRLSMMWAQKNPASGLSALSAATPIPPDGSSLRTNRGMYSVVSGAWVDTAGNPADPDISERLSQMWEQQNQIVGVAGFPNKDVTINTSVGQFTFTTALGSPKWFSIPPGSTAGSRMGPEVTDPKIVAKLNEIVKQQSKP